MFEVDGVAVHDEGQGPEALLFVHGWPDTYRLWDAQVESLRGRYRCLRFTLPGFEPGGRRAMPLDAMCELLRRIVERAGAAVTLVAHDWGSLYGYHFAMCHPQLVARLVGVDVGDAFSRAHRAELGFKAKAGIAAYQLWLALAWRIGGRLGDAMARRMARLMRAPGDPSTIHAGMGYPYDMAWTGSHGGFRHARAVDAPMPMLFVYGARSPLRWHSRPWAERLAARPGCRVVGLPTGHWVMRKGDHFNRTLAEWLEQTPLVPAAAA